MGGAWLSGDAPGVGSLPAASPIEVSLLTSVANVLIASPPCIVPPIVVAVRVASAARSPGTGPMAARAGS
jgi:hypothetical protein